MGKSITIRVPATSANCGPGFDTLGVACTLYNELTLSLLSDERLEIEIEGEGADEIARDERNLAWQSIRCLLKKAHAETEFLGAKMFMRNRVPISSGLGSSSAAIVAGLKAANVLLGNVFDRHELLEIATEIEGHPDNVAPALYGGFTVSVVNDGRPDSFSFFPKTDLRMVAAIPSFPLSTKMARDALPKSVSMKDAVFNVSHAAFLVAALMKGNPRFLRYAFDDALHQPYREKLVPGMSEVFRAAKTEGAVGAVLSGAGPSVVAYTVEREREIGEAMVDAFRRHGVDARAMTLYLDKRGAHIVKPESIGRI